MSAPSLVERQVSSLGVDDIPSALDVLRIGWAARQLAEVSTLSQCSIDRNHGGSCWGNGDVVVARVVSPGQHRALITEDNRRLRLYRDDVIIGVMGARYASDAFESEICDTGPLHMVTASGMCSTVQSKNAGTSDPTVLELIGALRDPKGNINLIERKFEYRRASDTSNVVLVLGSGMNAGKTTTSRRLVKALLRAGKRVAACKITGSVSHRDLFEYVSVGPHDVRDFSFYGFPSTYGCSPQQIEHLFETMVADASDIAPDVIVMEVADGVLQPDTWELLQSDSIRRHICGVVYAAPCSLSAIEGVQRITACGHHVWAVSGIICNSPLMVREFETHCAVPVLPSSGQATGLANCVIAHLAPQAHRAR